MVATEFMILKLCPGKEDRGERFKGLSGNEAEVVWV